MWRVRDVVPQDTRLHAVDQLAEVGVDGARIGGIQGDRSRAIGERADRPRLVGPVETTRVVHPEAEPARADRGGEISDDVTRRVPVALAGIRHLRGPQAVAIVVLGDLDDVAGTGGGEEIRPRARVPSGEHRRERVAEVLVAGAAPHRGMMPCRRTARDPQRVPVPLGVGRQRLEIVIVSAQQLRERAGSGRESGNTRQAPVYEDPELRVLEPGRNGMAAQRRRRRCESRHPAQHTRRPASEERS